MHIAVMNNNNLVANHRRTVVQSMKFETTTKIYSVRKLDTLIYANSVIYFDFVFYLIRISNFLLFFGTNIFSRLGS